jgi:hypothetical protein
MRNLVSDRSIDGRRARSRDRLRSSEWRAAVRLTRFIDQVFQSRVFIDQLRERIGKMIDGILFS